MQAIKGIYRNGQIELLETPKEVKEARVIVTFLETESEAPAAEEADDETTSKSFAEVAAHLIGSVKSGVGDLSTNKNHMEGFGRD
ncbi:MAG: hypothetical protein ACR2LC_01495 [Pyrinomonadaceae bacterium]